MELYTSKWRILCWGIISILKKIQILGEAEAEAEEEEEEKEVTEWLLEVKRRERIFQDSLDQLLAEGFPFGRGLQTEAFIL